MSLRRKLQPYKAPAGPLPTPAALASLLLLRFTYIPPRAFLLAWPAALHSLTSTAKILRSLLRFRLFREILLPHLYKMIPRPTCRFIHFYSRTPRFFSIALETSRFFFFTSRSFICWLSGSFHWNVSSMRAGLFCSFFIPTFQAHRNTQYKYLSNE